MTASTHSFLITLSTLFFKSFAIFISLAFFIEFSNFFPLSRFFDVNHFGPGELEIFMAIPKISSLRLINREFIFHYIVKVDYLRQILSAFSLAVVKI